MSAFRGDCQFKDNCYSVTRKTIFCDNKGLDCPVLESVREIKKEEERRNKHRDVGE